MLFQSMPWVSERALPRLIPRLWADWAPGYDAREDLADVFAALDTPERRTAALRYYRALLYPWLRRRAYAHEQAHWAGTPAVPTLYLHGAQDGCALAAVAERARGVLAAGSRVEILAACGHFPQLELPAEVNERIAAFIEEA
jgi:pimeloyl-ACP methyl ester carboxylesterase